MRSMPLAFSLLLLLFLPFLFFSFFFLLFPPSSSPATSHASSLCCYPHVLVVTTKRITPLFAGMHTRGRRCCGPLILNMFVLFAFFLLSRIPRSLTMSGGP